MNWVVERDDHDPAVTRASDPAAMNRAVRLSVAHVVDFLGDETPGVLSRAIDTVRELGDRSYTLADVHVDLDVALESSDIEAALRVSIIDVDERDRAHILRHLIALVLDRRELGERLRNYIHALGRAYLMSEAEVDRQITHALTD